MSITPDLPSVGSSPLPLNSQDPQVTTTTTSQIADGQSTYSADLATGNRLSVQAFSKIILAATSESNQVSWETQQYNATSRKNFYQASISQAMGLLEIYAQLSQLAQSYTDAYTNNKNQISTVNAQINTFNSSIPDAQAAVDTLNDAITKYNNEQITLSQLNNVILTYNSFAISFNNTSVATTTNSIDIFNQEAEAANFVVANLNLNMDGTGIQFTGQNLNMNPPQKMPTRNTLPPSAHPPTSYLTFTPSTIQTVTNTMDPPVSNPTSLTNSLFAPYYSMFAMQFTLTATILQMQSSYRKYVQFYLLGHVPYLPPAFYRPMPQLFLSSSGSGVSAGSGVSLASIVASLNNPLVSAIIAQGIFTSNMNLFSMPATQRVINQLKFFNLQLLSKIGLLSGSPALRLLAGRLPFIDLRSSPVALALGLALTNEIALAVASGSIFSGIKQILSQAYPGLAANSLNALAFQLATSSEIFMLQIGLFQLGLSLNSPSLFGQLLGTLTSAQALGLLSPINANIFGRQSIQALQNAMARNVSQQTNISFREAKDIINDSIIAAAIGAQFNQQFIVSNLIQRGINTQIALNAAIYAEAYVRAEAMGQGLLDDRFSTDLLSRSLLANELVSGLLLNHPDITTNRELRDLLAEQFFANGNTQEAALLAATLAVIGNRSLSPMALETLRSQLYDLGTNQLNGLGASPSEIQNIATQLVSTVLGANIPGSQTSVRDLLDLRMNSLVKLQNTTIIDQLNAATRLFLEPHVELYALAERLRDPANTFLLCAQTGIMYTHSQPSNYIKGVDIMG